MSDLSRLLLFGTDSEIRAVGSDTSRPKVSVTEAERALSRSRALLGISFQDAVLALSPTGRGLRSPHTSGI